MAGLSIQELRLSPMTEKAALLILKFHPDAVFSDGRRDLGTQAQRMATNAIHFGSHWLYDTYKNKAMAKVLMEHMEECPEECSSIGKVGLLAKSFHGLLVEHFSDYFNQMPHIRGDAFDIKYPRLANGLHDVPRKDRIMSTIRRLPEYGIALDWVTDQEGQLKVIHAQFNPAAGSVSV